MSKNALPTTVMIGRVSDVQLFSRARVKREPRSRPTKNGIANLAPLRLRRYFADNDSQFIASRILKRNVKITVCFSFERNDAAPKSEPFLLKPCAF
jgi:hypothetical protein